MRKSLFIFAISFLLLTACGKKTAETSPIHKDIAEMIFASGTLEPDDKYNLTAQSDGYLTSLTINEGDEVKVGTQVGYIDNKTNISNAENANAQLAISETFTTDMSPALQSISANIIMAKQKFAQEQLQLDRYKRLYESNSISKLEYENAQLSFTNAKENLAALTQQYNNTKKVAEQQYYAQRGVAAANAINKNYNQIVVLAPGKVYKKMKEVGDYIRKGDVIATIGKSNFIYAKLNVDETSIKKIKIGQPVIIQLNTDKDTKYKAEIFEILPSFDEVTQSFICKAKFVEPLTFNIIGTQLEANVVVNEFKNILVIPRSFLKDGNNVQLKSKKELQKIETGFVSTEWVQVKSGISENDVLLTDKIKK